MTPFYLGLWTLIVCDLGVYLGAGHPPNRTPLVWAGIWAGVLVIALALHGAYLIARRRK
jgi:uncharacterized membrane protein